MPETVQMQIQKTEIRVTAARAVQASAPARISPSTVVLSAAARAARAVNPLAKTKNRVAQAEAVVTQPKAAAIITTTAATSAAAQAAMAAAPRRATAAQAAQAGTPA